MCRTFKSLLLTVFASVSVLPCYSWDKKGHDITAAIAQRHLTNSTRKKINELLDGKSLIYWAPWMDDASNMPEYRHTKSWHYFDIEEGSNAENTPHDNKGDIITAITAQMDIVKDKNRPREERQLALKFLIHMIGDLHQPFHIGHPQDKGGNTIKVTFFGRETSVHSMWDGGMASRAHDWNHTEWAEELDIKDKNTIAKIASGTVTDWANESHQYADEIYKSTPEGSNLSFPYVREWVDVLEHQFLYGGIRLAKVLNEIL